MNSKPDLTALNTSGSRSRAVWLESADRNSDRAGGGCFTRDEGSALSSVPVSLVSSARVNRHSLPTQWRAGLLPRAATWVIAWLIAGLWALPATAESYVVKRGDTLYSIAKEHGISVATLAERNGLSRNYHVYAGQRLNLGAATPESAQGGSPERSAISDSVRRRIDQTPVEAGRWKYIVIHHSGLDTGTVAAMDRYHREVRHMENGIAYHFVIGNGHGIADGAISVCPRWSRQLDGGHLASDAQNHVALGICLVGNFDKHRPTPAQMRSLSGLVRVLMARCRLTPAAVRTHRQINIVHTECSGANFPLAALLKALGAGRS